MPLQILAFFRVILTLLNLWSIHTTLTPPTTQPLTSSDKHVHEGTLTAWQATFGGRKLEKLLAWTCALLETATILANATLSSKSIPTFLTYHSVATTKITPLSLLGTALLISGTLIRLKSYSHLGNMFTFTLSIRSNHRLVTTGPYSIVRHPSYTGLLLCGIGFALTNLTRGSWLMESRFTGGIGAGIGMGMRNPYAFIGCLILGVRLALWVTVSSFGVLRSGIEDDALRREFKDEWELWRERVPYKIAPYVY